jgi:hypothetical protein
MNREDFIGAVVLLLIVMSIAWLLAWAFNIKEPLIPAPKYQVPISQQQLPWWMVD